MAVTLVEPHAEKNRYRFAPKAADYTIDQDWASYSSVEHDRWDRLYRRQMDILPGRACSAFLEATEKLELSRTGIPDFAELSSRLQPRTGWEVVPVADLVPDDVFFEHLANRRFPAGAFIRPEAEMDYLEEPDVFHDVFGHVPLLVDPVYADYLQAYGEGGRRALRLGVLGKLARLYWYTVEFGLIEEAGGLRIFGAGILSSPAESVFSLEDGSPNRVRFALERLMRTKYIIDDFQQTYFVIDSFENLLDACYQDFGPIYKRLENAGEIEAHDLTAEDDVVHRGSHAYFDRKKAV